MPTSKLLRLSLAADELKQPLHLKIRQILRERILADFEHGQRFYSERELIEKLSVSQPTIRRALNDLAQEGYLLPEPRRGFFVQLKTETRYTGFILPDSSLNSLGPAYAVCRDQGCVLNAHYLHRNEGVDDLLRSIHFSPREERLLISGLTVDTTLALSSQLQSRGYQHIILGPRVPGLFGGSISPDYEAEVDQVLDHLTGLGHERILFIINEPAVLLITSLRAAIIRRKLKERGLHQASIVSCDTKNWDDSFDAAYRKTEELLKTRPWPTAIVPLSGIGAWSVMRYALTHNIRVPQDISIVSFERIDNADLLPVPMTEMTFSSDERTALAITHLWGTNPSAVNVLLTPKLVVRGSSGPAPF